MRIQHEPLVSNFPSNFILTFYATRRRRASWCSQINIMSITFTWTQDNRTYLFSLFQANNMKKVIWSWMFNCKKKAPISTCNKQRIPGPRNYAINDFWVCQAIMTARWASKTVSLKWKKVTNVPKIYRASAKKGLEKCSIEILQPGSSLKSNHLMMKFAFIFAQFYRGLNVI